ncbi:Gfo/Idh/MocA family oxidoreductase [Bacillus sp. 165]|uniref:Gfo/Idh/MocA family protein n=1 Tax=Bacillus sp. 165 TaxID=1529117 RepID=UPI001ADD5983|nr:Gfo/Idh/MocA family oxidoreductase [Bacillus sp. 165]MBO9130676.1 Gfo/Idh/MocA family oxidoreductase [Bacillus sp. 165]
MRKPRIGMIGLGNIAQKAYLPILTKETDWTFTGAYTPNKEKRKRICEQYRIRDFENLPSLAQECDAIFVHSSTDSHYDVVSELLKKGKDVYVDKPLAASLSEAEKLVELSEKYGRRLMVGFNRRFAPMYVKARQQADKISLIRIEKHRMNSVGPYSYDFTMLDDYLHLVDTARWLGGDLALLHGTAHVNDKKQLVYAQHLYESLNNLSVFTNMHRRAGTNLEQIEIVTEGAVIRVKNMHTMEVEQDNAISTALAPSWDTTLKQRGFEDAVGHFIQCVIGDSRPQVDGEEGVKSQQLLHQMLHLMHVKGK